MRFVLMLRHVPGSFVQFHCICPTNAVYMLTIYVSCSTATCYDVCKSPSGIILYLHRAVNKGALYLYLYRLEVTNKGRSAFLRDMNCQGQLQTPQSPVTHTHQYMHTMYSKSHIKHTYELLVFTPCT